MWTRVHTDKIFIHTKGTCSKQILQRGFHLPARRGHVFTDSFCFLTVTAPVRGWVVGTQPVSCCGPSVLLPSARHPWGPAGKVALQGLCLALTKPPLP